jgi:hypothetical protein
MEPTMVEADPALFLSSDEDAHIYLEEAVGDDSGDAQTVATAIRDIQRARRHPFAPDNVQVFLPRFLHEVTSGMSDKMISI